MAEGDDEILRPDQSIVPNPCGEAETNRNWDAVRRILNQVVNNQYTGGSGSLIAEVTLIPDLNQCVKPVVDCDPGSFRPLFLEDPANPMIRPSLVYNKRRMGVAPTGGVNPKGYIVFDPNDTSLQSWELLNMDHINVTILSDAEYVGGTGIHFLGLTATVIPCGPALDDVNVDIPTVQARAIYNLGLNGVNGCSLISNEVTMEVFSSTNDPTDYVEFSFDSVQVLTDVYQSTAYGNILGYYWRLYVPCATLVGEDLLIYVDRCVVPS